MPAAPSPRLPDRSGMRNRPCASSPFSRSRKAAAPAGLPASFRVPAENTSGSGWKVLPLIDRLTSGFSAATFCRLKLMSLGRGRYDSTFPAGRSYKPHHIDLVTVNRQLVICRNQRKQLRPTLLIQIGLCDSPLDDCEHGLYLRGGAGRPQRGIGGPNTWTTAQDEQERMAEFSRSQKVVLAPGLLANRS
jgi:hypothetical protein